MEPGAGASTGGLTTREVLERLRAEGPNRIPEERPTPFRLFARKLWAPVPWMLEGTLLLELVLGRTTQAAIILALLLLNAAISYAQEQKAQGALDLLRSRLRVLARVLRDGRWESRPAEEIVRGDRIYLRMGDIVPADVKVRDGHLLVDSSALTGESAGVEAEAGKTVYAGSVVQRGEGTADVSATGPSTYFGRTAELVRTARAPGHLESIILRIVQVLVALDAVLVVGILAFAVVEGLPLVELLPFSLILLVASVPVALPATFTLATALGARELAGRGILVTRLSAIEEAAAMDVLCSDKTGTLTQNRLVLRTLEPAPPTSVQELLEWAALACDEATQDPIDLAVLAQVRAQGIDVRGSRRLRFVPFDPATKRSEATVERGAERLQVLKGAPHMIARLVEVPPDLDARVEALGRAGRRVLAVAAGPEGRPVFLGLLGFEDPPRPDARNTVERLQALGVHVVMVTGDSPATARAVAEEVGLGQRVCHPEVLRSGLYDETLGCSVFANVLPEDKFHLVRARQKAGHVVGMTGDGVNDAPALKQADMGVAVADATDVAKAAAGVVLTRPGLSDLPVAVDVGRQVYQRMLTYTINKIVKTFHIALFLGLGFLVFRAFVTTPRHILLLLFTNDFVTMSLSSDRVFPSRSPDRWDVRGMSLAALVLAALWLCFGFGVFWVGRAFLKLPLAQVQTLDFLMLVFTGLATVFLVRERRHYWASRPGRWLALALAGDVLVVCLIAVRGILVTPLPLSLVLGLLAAVLAAATVLDFAKLAVFRRTGLA